MATEPLSTPPPALSSTPLVLRGRARSCPLQPRTLLAPMDGVTDRRFRLLVARHGGLGASCTEFLRISINPVGTKQARRELGDPAESPCPVGLQLMASDADYLSESAAACESAGPAFIDLNFGCPVKRVYNKCAGSAMLAHPQRMAAIVAACVAGTGLPVSAKIRAGIDSPDHLEEILQAVGEAGANAVAVHARLRIHTYTDPSDWSWLARSADYMHRHFPGVPVIGNGSVDEPQDIARMRRETGVDAVMVGRAALANPWIFAQAAGAPPPTAADAAQFALAYFADMCTQHPARPALGRLKQMLKFYRAGDLLADDAQRIQLLRERDPAVVVAWLRKRAENG